MPSARPARPTSPASGPRAGCWSATATTTAASPAARWSGPALKRLLADIEAGRVDVVVVYKIDRLSRSLMDFAKLVEVFDRTRRHLRQSVTQSFNTTTSMGRLTLNILLSFAQFEREVIGERIRDKFAASRQKGMWMGGSVPLGYDVQDRKLVVNEAEAATVRIDLRAVRRDRLGDGAGAGAAAPRACAPSAASRSTRATSTSCSTTGSTSARRCTRARPIPASTRRSSTQELWDKVHAILRRTPATRAANTRAQTPALLKGLIFGPTGAAMSPTHTRKGGRLYRYYVSQDVLKRGRDACPVGRVPAAEIEAAVIDQLRGVLRQPEIIVGTWRAARAEQDDITEDEVREALPQLDPLWDELFPAEQARIVQLLVERVDVHGEGVDVRLPHERHRCAGPRNREEGGMTDDDRTVTVRIPLVFKKHGGRKTVISPDGRRLGGAAAARRPHLVRALARAFRWQRLLDEGRTRPSMIWRRPKASASPTSAECCG